jgi:competence CoiA-like predicted nuclease
MEYALSKVSGKKIKATDADYGKFTCPVCGKPVGLRKTHIGKKLPHFYHTGRLEDPHCKLSYYEDNWKKKPKKRS